MDGRFTADEAASGERLDAALARLAPNLGLRARQRLCARGLALVNGRARPKGYRLARGEVVELAPGALAAASAEGLEVPVVARRGGYLALMKPPGLHSAAVAGGGEPSVEAMLPDIAPGCVLLNRLDRSTSGLLLAAADQEAEVRFRDLEARGEVEKIYLAVVMGEISAPATISNALDTADRKKTRVLDRPDPDPARHTSVAPVRPAPGLGGFLVRAVIHRGARHQIRAHLASIGHPIVDDPLYGPGPADAGRIHLHHEAVAFAGFSAQAPPDWEEG